MGIGLYPTDSHLEPACGPVDVWMHLPAYICVPAPGKCVGSAKNVEKFSSRCPADFVIEHVGILLEKHRTTIVTWV